MSRQWLVAAAAFTLLLTGCGEAPKRAEKKKAPPAPLTGMSAFFKMFGQARTWAPDVQGMKCEPIAITGQPSGDGKWPAWRCQFVSESKKRSKTFSFSIVEAEGVHEGVFGGPEESYTGPVGQTLPFIVQALKKDSDAAIRVAKEKSKAYMAKNPDMPITVVLERTKRHPNLAWRVIWGTSLQTSNYSIYVDASTGEYLETMH